ncbi:HD domain-containing protein [Streptomyces sp. SAS_270]|uniref:HD domain-containing protein n=1 Tax=Streptomyces sp. SAS_270 TaxID=3412748 RepID=UPI00403CADA4
MTGTTMGSGTATTTGAGPEAGAGPRIALLIGVASTPDAAHRFVSLEEPVAADQRLLGASLQAAGYAVETLCNATRAEIATRIDEVAREVVADGTLLLHFSGHGIRIGDIDYLVPSDARAPGDGDWRPSYRESLLPADISPYLGECRAGTVLWLIDACRDQPSGEEGVFGSRILRGQPTGRFALMTSCGAGQRSGYTGEGSFFTQGLAEAFRPMTQARTVQEVYETARQHTLRSARQHLGEVQEVQVRYGTELESEARSAVVCEGRRLLEAWREAVSETTLWERVPEEDSACLPRLRECLTALVEECATVVHHAQRRMPDPWADDGFPVRVLRDRLPGLIPKTTALSALEAAALVAAPFLYEAARARRLSHAKDVSPYHVWHEADGDTWRRHYEQVADHHPHIAKKLSECWCSARVDEARGVALWLVHRWITERFETDEEAVPQAESRTLAAALLDAPEDRGSRTAELSRVLCAVASGIPLGAAPEESSAADVAFPVPGSGRQSVRSAELAALLHLASVLALDARTLPDVLAEHLAVSDPVLPQDAVNAAHDADWHPADDELHLDAACRHPAVHAALAQVVEQADELACALRESARRLAPHRAALLAGAPSRVTDRDLRPVEDRGRRTYDVPLLRFQLAQTEVRDLLMGERIYDGEPDLALRELYQNAMDACRYRAMRRRHVEARGGRPGPWAAHITVVEGEDERGRYVECRDNGVGMTLDQLRNTFTKAGRRFEQSRAFRQEQANWHRQDPSLRLYPNSRFGIGVFSYFMLADEMVVITRPVGTDGIPARKALRVEIPGSANLFRIREHDDTGDGLLEGGTSIRLYLRDSITLSGAFSPVATLQRLVLVSEFELDVEETSGNKHHWEPGVLQYPSGVSEGDGAVEAVPGVLWWVADKGAILCDGIGTDRQPFGYVLNLTGAQAGRLSLNRKKLQAYDTAWERTQWSRGASALAAWQGLHLAWLWRLESENLDAARAVWEKWRGTGVLVSRKSWRPAVNLDSLGWFHHDTNADKPTRSGSMHQERGELTEPWRRAALNSFTPGSGHSSIASLAGYAVPAPGWAGISTGSPRFWDNGVTAPKRPDDWRSVVALAYDQDTTVIDVLRVMRALRIAHPALSPPRITEGDLDWAPDYHDVQIMEGLLSRSRTKRRWQSEEQNDYCHAWDDLGGLVRASATTHRTLGQLVEACVKYAPFLPGPVPAVPEHHRDHVCDEADLSLLYVDDNGSGWRPTRRPWDVTGAAVRLGIPWEEALQRLALFGWLGWAVPDVESVRRWSQVPWEILSVLREYCLPGSNGGFTLPRGATFQLAADWEIPLRRAEKELARWAGALGLAYHRHHREKSVAGRVEPSLETANVAGAAHANGLLLEDGLSLRDLAFIRPGVDREDLSYAMEELRQAGVEVPAADSLLRAWDDLPVPSRYAFSGRDPSWDGADYPVLPTADVLFASSVELQTPLATMWKTARREARRFGLSVPDLPAGLREFSPKRLESHALIDWGDPDEYDGEWFESPRWAPLTAERLVDAARAQHLGAREAFQRLAPLRELGALIPELSPAQVEGLPEEEPDAKDAVALGAEHRVSAPGEPLCPLDLVSLAGRLGEPLDRTWRRIVPYLPLQPPPRLASDPVAAIPAVLPLWQDLIVLSVHADGVLPALRGPVTAEHLRFTAHAVDESEDWVRERLGLYAGLFELEL